MNDDTQIRPMSETDVELGIELVMKVFNEFVAPDLRTEGIASFVEWANPAAFAERLRGEAVAFVAVNRNRVLGVIEWMRPDHLAMLFVDPSVQGEGIGQRLFEGALHQIRADHQDTRTIRVHASRYAVPFYQRLGFREEEIEQEENGIRYTPMLFEVEE